MAKTSNVHYIAALDVGTTTVRCHILDSSAKAVGTASDQVQLLYPEPGRVEIAPEKLWITIVDVVRKAISDAGLTSQEITCLGISTQRCTFITWNRVSGKPYHNFITWKDVRADSLVREWNESLTMKSLRSGASCLYLLSRSKRFLAGSVLRLMNTQVTMRLVWVLDNVAGIRDDASKGLVLFGTVDTWLLHRLTAGQLHVTDASNASATGFFDPFTMRWGDWGIRLFNIPVSMLPSVTDTAGDFGTTSADIWGSSIPIRSSVADQAASLFGSCCFEVGDVKVTLGTGTFLNVNTGSQPHASIAGLYPVIGWKLGEEIVYVAEGASSDTGTIIQWAQNAGLVKDPKDSSEMAMSVQDSGGVFFIPAFSGLQAPINDFQAASGFLGIKPSTSPQHLVRSILESITFRVLQLYQVFLKEANFKSSLIRVDGGVSRNDFVSQLLADLTGLEVERPNSSEMSVLGAGFLAGLYCGVWNSREELKNMRKVDQVFSPRKGQGEKYRAIIQNWERAVGRFLHWYSPGS